MDGVRARDEPMDAACNGDGGRGRRDVDPPTPKRRAVDSGNNSADNGAALLPLPLVPPRIPFDTYREGADPARDPLAPELRGDVCVRKV